MDHIPIVGNLTDLGVDKQSKFWWRHERLVCYPQWRKYFCCRSEDGSEIPRGGPKVNFPFTTLNKFKSFLLSFLRQWSRIPMVKLQNKYKNIYFHHCTFLFPRLSYLFKYFYFRTIFKTVVDKITSIYFCFKATNKYCKIMMKIE